MVITKSIRVTLDTYNRLAKLGDLSDSFDTVIQKLLNQIENRKRVKKINE